MSAPVSTPLSLSEVPGRVSAAAPVRPLWRVMLRRELQMVARRRSAAVIPWVFFLLSASLFPLGVGPEPGVLRQMAPGIVWVCALLSSMLALPGYFSGDHADGSLEQMLISGRSLAQVAAYKALSHWLLTGLPLMLLAPMLGLMFGLQADVLSTLEATLILGTPAFSMIGCFAAALTLGLRNGGVLSLLLALPLCIPVLIFAAGATSAADAGLSAQAHLSLLGAVTLLCVPAMPYAAAQALLLAVD